MVIDPGLVAIAGRVASLLKPLVVVGADELKKTVGVPIVDRLTGLLAKLRKEWAGDAEATQTVTDFARDPDAFEAKLTELLAQRMAADPELAASVDDDLQAIGPRVIITMEADRVELQKGPEIGRIGGKAQVNIGQKAGVAREQVGPKIDSIE